MTPRVGLVAIGRNEGERLRACLESAKAQGLTLVYVDSGSDDDSVAFARSIGAHVVELDLTRPFTAARARNEGFARLIDVDTAVEFVQFVDGDCALADGWIERALQAFARSSGAAVVCGRRRERSPGASIYNQLCDLEWDTPVGPALSCGGDSMMRREVFEKAGGFTPTVIAGEEPELCFRIRQMGFEVLRIDAEMTLHDAAMTRFGQWWRRNVRAGHAYAEGNFRHGDSPERFWRKPVVSNFVWATPAMWPLWPVLWAKVYRHRRSKAYATFTVLSKLPQAIGQLKFYRNHWLGRSSGLIEYK